MRKGEHSMSSEKGSKGNTTRRGFVKEVSAGAAAIAGALAASAMMPPKSMGMTNFGPVSVPAAEAGELKYRKCFLNELRPEEREKGFGAQNMFIVFADNDIIEGCQYFSAMYMGESATKTLGHGPHKHNVPEVLVALGSDPNNPRDLGGKFDLYMGEEMEKHVIDQPTLIYIPANTVHCPFTITEVRRPFLFIQAHYGLKLEETAMRNLVPEELRNKYIFIDADGKQKDVYVPPSERAKRRPPKR
jgi:hypothetical protein